MKLCDDVPATQAARPLAEMILTTQGWFNARIVTPLRTHWTRSYVSITVNRRYELINGICLRRERIPIICN